MKGVNIIDKNNFGGQGVLVVGSNHGFIDYEPDINTFYQ